MDGKLGIAGDSDRAPEPVHCEPLDEIVGRVRLAVEQEIVAVAPDNEVEQAFALRSEQAGPDRQLPRDVAGDESLDEPAHVFAREAEEGAIREGGCWHDHQLGSGAWLRKR